MKKKIIIMAIFILLCLQLQPAFAINLKGKDILERIDANDMEGIVKAIDDFKNGEDFKRTQAGIDNDIKDFSDAYKEKFRTNKEITFSPEDTIILYQMPFEYGEILSKNNSFQDLLQQSKKVFCCPVRINNIVKGNVYIVSKENKLFCSNIGFYYSEKNIFDILDSSEELDKMKQEIGVNDIYEIKIFLGSNNEGNFYYLNTPKGEYVLPYESRLESKILKAEEFIAKRVKREYQIALPMIYVIPRIVVCLLVGASVIRFTGIKKHKRKGL